MKIICILQNAWGGRNIPPVFTPNRLNKSAKTMRKVCGNNVMHFCNTSPHSGANARVRFSIDHYHFQKLLGKFDGYDVILVCGKQAEEAHLIYRIEVASLNKPVVIMKHPAARTLTNANLAAIKKHIDAVDKNKYSLTYLNK